MTLLKADSLLANLRAHGVSFLASYFSGQRKRLRRLVEKRLDNRVKRRVDASDIVQEGFLDAARRLDHFLLQPTMPASAWVEFLVRQQATVAYRRHVSAGKRDLRREQSLSSASTGRPGDQGCAVAAAETTASEIVSRREQCDLVKIAVAMLSPADQEVLRLRHLEFRNNIETAELLGISPPAASKRYVRALARFRAVIETASSN